jgi:hypothetical protein
LATIVAQEICHFSLERCKVVDVVVREGAGLLSILLPICREEAVFLLRTVWLRREMTLQLLFLEGRCVLEVSFDVLVKWVSWRLDEL